MNFPGAEPCGASHAYGNQANRFTMLRVKGSAGVSDVGAFYLTSPVNASKFGGRYGILNRWRGFHPQSDGGFPKSARCADTHSQSESAVSGKRTIRRASALALLPSVEEAAASAVAAMPISITIS